MSRSINESITALENARNDIVDALNSKIEGGNIEKTLKISEVAEKINSIKVGGSSSPNIEGFTLNKVTFNGEDITEYNHNLKTFDDKTTGDFVVEYNYTGYKSDLRLILVGEIYRQTIFDIYGTSQTFTNVTTDSDAGYTYALILLDVFKNVADIIFVCNLTDYSES